MQGGVGAFTHELAHALAQLNHTPFVLTDHRVHSSDNTINVSGSVQSWNRASLIAAREWAQANRLDIVNIQYEAAAFRMSQIVHFLPRLLGNIPTVTTFHDLLVPYLFPKAGPLRFKAILALARSSGGVIVTNVQDERRLSVEQGITRLCNIPIGSNVEASLPTDFDRGAWRVHHGIPADAVVVGYFGFMNASKGVDILLEGLAKALNTANIYLLMIGGRVGSSDATNVTHAEKITGMIEALGLQSRVQWTGFVEDSQVSSALTACDIVALPYRDGVSFRRGSFMAAIAHGCAIITTHPQIELPEVQDRTHALLIPIDADALAAAIRELANDPGLRANLQANARELAACFTWDRIAALTADFHAEVLGAPVR